MRYLTERAGQDINGVGAWASSVRYVDRGGQAVGEQQAGYRLTSYTTLHRRLSACLERSATTSASRRTNPGMNDARLGHGAS
jgi:hypothetical protein